MISNEYFIFMNKYCDVLESNMSIKEMYNYCNIDSRKKFLLYMNINRISLYPEEVIITNNKDGSKRFQINL